MSYYNPFQGLELLFPESARDDAERYTQTQATGGRKPSPDDSPFPRMIDLWFLALCVGARRGKRVRLEEPHKFNTAEILSRDPGRVEFIELVALAAEGSPDIIGSPHECLRIANEYAAGGLPDVLRMLKEGSAKPIWNLTDNLLDGLSDAGPPE